MQETKIIMTPDALEIINAIEAGDSAKILSFNENGLRDMGMALALYRRSCGENKAEYNRTIKSLNELYGSNDCDLRVVECRACGHISIVRQKYIDSQALLLEKIAVDAENMRINTKWHCQKCVDCRRFASMSYGKKRHKK